MGVEDGVGQVGLVEFAGADRGGEPAVVGLAGELEDPARHRDGDPVDGELTDERVHHFPGRFACDRYAAARRRTSFSCSSSRIPAFQLAQLGRLGRRSRRAGGRPRRRPWRSQFRRHDSLIPKSFAICRDRGLAPSGDATTSSRNSFGWGLGTVNILPAAPLGTTDQMSPIRAAVPGILRAGRSATPVEACRWPYPRR